MINESKNSTHLLNDNDIVDFIINGYLVLDTEIDKEINDSIITQLNQLDTNPGDLVTESIPDLKKVYNNPKVKGVLSSLLGSDYSINIHRHCHRNPPGSKSQSWHQDGGERERHPNQISNLLMMYYPQAVDLSNGPTALIPGSHLLFANPEVTASQGNFKHQVIAEVPAGHVLILHYDIWHAGTANFSQNNRFMVKFLFDRISESNSPSWDHDPNNLIDVTLRIDNSPIIGLQKSLTNKVVKLRREMWENISGSNNTINTRIGGNHYFDRFSGPWPSITPDGQKVKM